MEVNYKQMAKTRKAKRRRHKVHELIVNLIEVLGMTLGMILFIAIVRFILKLVWLFYAVYKLN